MHLAGRTILITGASQGLGRALALHCAQRGARLILAARNTAKLEAVARQAAGEPWVRPCDLSDPEQVRRLAQCAAEEAGGVDLLINNAADVLSKPCIDTSIEEIDLQLRTNLIGPLQLTRALLPGMLERERAFIVNISSLAGYKPNPAQTSYSISKAAVNGMSDALRAELRGTSVRVMNVALQSVATEEAPRPGAMPAAQFAAVLERALERETEELFLSPVSKWLMRLYRFYPPLMRLR